MKNLILHVYKTGKPEKPETIITLPLSVLHISMQLLPKKIKTILEKEGIDLSQCSELVKERDIKGALVELENPNEKMVISIKGTMDLRNDLGGLLGSPGKARYFSYEEDPMYTKRESELIQQFLQQHGRMPEGGEDDLDDLF